MIFESETRTNGRRKIIIKRENGCKRKTINNNIRTVYTRKLDGQLKE